MTEAAELAAELETVRMNARLYRARALGIRHDDFEAYTRKDVARWAAAAETPRAERISRAARRRRVRYCDDCGTSWTQSEGRRCPLCGRLGGTD